MFCTGDTIDQYRLHEMLGSGACGVVFAAENTVSRQRVALKLVPLCGRAGTREMNALRQYRDFDHPNLLRIHHAGIAGDYLYYTMDLADGKLGGQHLSSAELRKAAAGIADALAMLHAGKLLHRDIKPDNLFMLRGKPLLGDVGLLTSGEGASLAGTPGFLPPGIRRNGDVLSEYSDLYALAKSFYCLLSENPPGAYPQYRGPLDPDASVLLQAVLAVCDGTRKITSAAGFRDFLLNTKPPRAALFGSARMRRVIPGAVLTLVCAAVAAGVGYGVEKKWQTAENAAIMQQRECYETMRKMVNLRAGSRMPPPGKRISLEAFLRNEELKRVELENAVRERAGSDRKFRCFYVMKNEADEAEAEMDRLDYLPEDAPKRKAAIEDWRKKRAAYRKERDLLLRPEMFWRTGNASRP